MGLNIAVACITGKRPVSVMLSVMQGLLSVKMKTVAEGTHYYNKSRNFEKKLNVYFLHEKFCGYKNWH